MKIKVKNLGVPLKQHGNNIDLSCYDLGEIFEGGVYKDRAAEGEFINYNKGSIFKVNLGVAMELPEGYEARIIPRSSTRKHFGVMLTNSQGLIDTEYCGDNDYWFAEFYAIQDGHMKIGDRIVQFGIAKTEEIEIELVENLDNEDRGGHGSTGK